MQKVQSVYLILYFRQNPKNQSDKLRVHILHCCIWLHQTVCNFDVVVLLIADYWMTLLSWGTMFEYIWQPPWLPIPCVKRLFRKLLTKCSSTYHLWRQWNDCFQRRHSSACRGETISMTESLRNYCCLKRMFLTVWCFAQWTENCAQSCNCRLLFTDWYHDNYGADASASAGCLFSLAARDGCQNNRIGVWWLVTDRS